MTTRDHNISSISPVSSLSTKQEFPVIDTCVYLNHAAVAPWPTRTRDAVIAFATENADVGARHYPQWIAVEQKLRSQIAQFVNAPSAADIALLKNTSEALSFVARGFPWRAGDNVVIADEEFPSNRIVWESLHEFGVTVREVGLRHESDPEHALLAAADAQTRLLSVSSVQYASGLRLNLTRLGEACRVRGIAFCVDAIQGLGAFAHDVQSMHIDFLMADAHKWLLGPEGIALFYCRPEWRERLRLQEYGWHMVEKIGDYDRKDWQPAQSARRFECGSPNMLGIHAFSASLTLLLEVGMKTVEQRILERADYLLGEIQTRPQFELVTSPTAGHYAGIVTFRRRDTDTNALWRHLTERNVICAARGGAVRFSPHFYIPMEQLERSLRLVDEF